MKQIKLGVIGIGHLGIRHAEGYKHIPGVKLCAISEIDPRRLRKVSHHLGVPGYIDYHKLFDHFQSKNFFKKKEQNTS